MFISPQKMILFNDKLRDTFSFIISKDIWQHGEHTRISLEGEKNNLVIIK